MRRAGGLIALIAGLFSIIPAVCTFFFPKLGSEDSFDMFLTIIGGLGIFFSFLIIILGAIVLSTKSKIAGILLIPSSIVGGLTSGAFVAIFMILALIGGILVVIEDRKDRNKDNPEPTPEPTPEPIPQPTPELRPKQRKRRGF
jgi:general stress protein CsbA